MKIEPFFTERFFAVHEFTAPYLLCASDCEPLTVAELLALAGAPPEVLTDLHLGYTETQGDPTLRARIAATYEGLAPEQVVGLSAPEEGIFVTMHALLAPGDEVVVLTPCYDSLLNLVRYLGCQVTHWPLVEWPEPPAGPGGWRLDVAALQRLVTARTRLIVVNFPHNPTGYLPSRDEWQAIVRIAEGAGAWLFSDEMYRGLEHEPASRLPSGCEIYERAISLAGLSKVYGLPGLRTGWLALQDAGLRERIVGWKDYTTICASAPSERLARLALGAGERLAARSRGMVTDNLALAGPFFERWGHLFRWHPPRATSVALAGLRSGSATAFCRQLVEASGVLLLPGTGLGAGDEYVRFGFGRLSFPEALSQLEAYLARQAGG
jgi:aspartate/methionine/tyrosine aminotransferase